MQFKKLTKHLLLLGAVAGTMTWGVPVQASALFNSGLPAGWSCQGNCGTDGADGVVTSSPVGGSYGYVTTYNSQYTPTGPVTGGTTNGNGQSTNGSVLTSSVFAANVGDSLQFYFNFTTADGAGWADYAWAKLVNVSSPADSILLFTARTTPGGSSVPGFGMPAPGATINPATVSVTPNATTWSPLGPNGDGSGFCFDTGCGSTGWVSSTYDIASAGSYILEFGVANWGDNSWQTGLAFDGITVAGTPIEDVPEPISAGLLGAGLVGLGLARRRKAQ